MKNFDSILRQQHKGIQKSLAEVSLTWENLDTIACALALGELSFLLSEHHETEFSILFSKIWDNPKLKEGGPFCTYFYSFLLHERPFTRVTRIVNQVRSSPEQFLNFELPKTLQPLFDARSMACVPLEEHLAIKELVAEMKSIMQNWDDNNKDWFAMALYELQDLIQKNIEKEETCLWTIAQNIR